MALKVLIIEDDASIQKLLSTILGANQYDVLDARTGAQALSMAASYCPDIILLDLGLPDMDGTTVLTTIRTWSSAPVIILSARTNERDKVEALDLGADDYITKPFGSSELLARMRMALRHANGNSAQEPGGKFVCGGLVVDYDKYRVYVNGQDAKLTQGEYRLVALLSRYAGRVLTYDFIMKNLWGPYKKDDNRILRVNMANIRRKIEASPADPQYIFTEVGVGYRMAEPDEEMK